MGIQLFRAIRERKGESGNLTGGIYDGYTNCVGEDKKLSASVFFGQFCLIMLVYLLISCGGEGCLLAVWDFAGSRLRCNGFFLGSIITTYFKKNNK